MSDFKHHVLAYCLENQETADSIATDFSHIGLQLERHGCPGSQAPVFSSMSASDSKILLLITDNFLKNADCMDGILEKVRSWVDQGQLFPIVADGSEMAPDGSVRSVPTAFDRVSHIIQYMNYWQDKYLELRKEKRNQDEDPELERKLDLTKKVSSDVGELLRFLRTIPFYTLEELKGSNYAILTGKNEDSEPAPAAQNAPTAGESSLIKMIEDSSEELMAENSELSKEEEEVPGIALKDIPGIDLLQELEAEPIVEEEKEEAEAFEAGSLADQLMNEVVEEAEVSKKSKSSKKKKDKAKKEPEHAPPAFDEDDEEMNAILKEVLMEEDEDDNDEFRFLGDDPENPDDFDLDSLFDDDEVEDSNGHLAEIPDEESIGEDEILLEMLDEEDEPMLQNGKHATAEEILEHAISLFRGGQKDEALVFLNEAVGANPQDTTLRYYYAYTLARYGQRQEGAENQLNIILQQDGQHTDALFLLAELAENKADIANAKSLFEKVAEIDAEYPEIYFRLGLLTVQHFGDQVKNAADLFKKAVQQDNENAEAHYLLANLMNEKLQDRESAVVHFRKTLELNPEHPFANYDLALLYHGKHDAASAEDYYKKAIRLNPELRTPQNDLAFSQPQSGVASDLYMEPAAEAPVFTQEETNAVSQMSQPSFEDYARDTSFVVLITGATSGIGKATAEIFAKNGHRIIATGRREDRLEELKADFENRFGTTVETLVFDVRNLESAQSALDNLPEELKNVDILINNAGLSRGLAPIHEGRLEDWETMIDTNIKGMLYMTRAIAPGMVERRKGHIINISSSAGKEVYPGGNVYCATKSAVEALTKSMRLDLYQHNVRVSQVAPGHVEETEFAKVRFDGDEARAAKVYENFQPLKSSDVAEAIYFIATRPPHVNIQDVYMFGTQQAGSNFIDRSGR